MLHHHHPKNTKIVATLGPSSDDPKTITNMVRAGMNVARINASHGDQEQYRAMLAGVRKASKETGTPIAALLDLCGPKIRIGSIAGSHITLEAGARITLTSRKVTGDDKEIGLNYSKLPKEVHPGLEILLDDGKRVLRVVETHHGTDIVCEVIVGGELRGHKGVNVPGAKLTISSITAKDRKDAAFAAAQGFDLVALSFVRHERDIDGLRSLLEKHGSHAGIIAKIETREALEHLDAIIAAADGVMVARGDLALEVSKEEVPLAQMEIVRRANAAGKPSIVATQMLDSMTAHPMPTRAEVGDVATAIFDGADSVMLSQETAIGIDPVHVVGTMAGIAARIEASALYKSDVIRAHGEIRGLADAVSSSVERVAKEIDAKAIVAMTASGFTARVVSRHKPGIPILALTPSHETERKLALSYGVRPRKARDVRTLDRALGEVRKELLKTGLAQRGDHFVLVLGMPFGMAGKTNTLVVQTV